MLDDADRLAPPPEVDGFLRKNSRAYVFLCDNAGEVRGWPLTSFYQAGVLFFTTYGKSVKVAFMEQAASATVVIATPEGIEPVGYCEATGAIRVVPFTPDVVDRFMKVAITSKESEEGARVSEKVKQRFRDRIFNGKRVLIEVDVTMARLGTLVGKPAA